MTARLYHRDQPSSPALTFSTGNTDAHWISLVAVLKGCLVSGYGVQPPAGWELIAEGASYLVLRNGSHSGYVCLSHSTTVVTISVAETYTGVSAGLIQGAGAKSGVATGSTIPHKFMARFFAYATGNSSWFVVADANTFVLGKTGTGSSSEQELVGSNGSVYAQATVYVGEDAAGNFIACGGDNTTNTGITAVAQRFSTGFTALRDPATGLLVDSGALNFAFPGMHSVDLIATGHTAVIPDARLVPMLWTSGGAVSRLRGVCMEPRIGLSSCSVGAQMLGYPGPLMSRTAHTPIDLGDGFNYVIAPRYSGNGTLFLVTDNPEFW
ncbi:MULTISPECIES: hypothetical protein [unclassified Pseudomonas]|uniref:hypothetical protein n=1 Tax=unclassified Pseudomonas TaxID=196821 RepID=UPI00244CAC73|nr:MULTISPECIES: hypothetical protein [unclassified Pseudomonas]MDH0894219.1 hypothetical protein [Pseudomonas sp. GD03875]MDH1063486.1 hypothetical protein [Pseudomonas sp. GD03985]